jgi:hypothetical protein
MSAPAALPITGAATAYELVLRLVEVFGELAFRRHFGTQHSVVCSGKRRT